MVSLHLPMLLMAPPRLASARYAQRNAEQQYAAVHRFCSPWYPTILSWLLPALQLSLSLQEETRDMDVKVGCSTNKDVPTVAMSWQASHLLTYGTRT
jgi:hypothetical protein